MREHKDIHKYEQHKGRSRVYKKKTRDTRRGPGRIGPRTVYWWSMLPLRHSDQQPGESTSSKIQDLNMRIQGVRTPQWVVMRMPNGMKR